MPLTITAELTGGDCDSRVSGKGRGRSAIMLTWPPGADCEADQR